MNTSPTAPNETHIEPAHAQQVREGQRFKFGANWARFLRLLDERRIQQAEKSLVEMLEREDLSGLSFLDAGSGSGLFSLAARRLGATVTSVDFDPQSVACTRELRRRYFPDDDNWKVLEGSVLDAALLGSLGTFDVVYSWGVLHHTGDMWRAIDLTQRAVKPGGQYFIALYNDQGMRSRVWAGLKRAYCSGFVGRIGVSAICIPYFVITRLISDVVRLRNPIAHYRDYHRNRGMSVVRDWVDWLGGYPFEVASPAATFDFVRARGFRLDRLVSTLGSGCNEFVFRRER
ncbi:MAG TPA: methyltransferase domain-containing protein [Gemmatimonadaceae bacterium]